MLEPKKPIDDGIEPGDPAQQKDLANQVDSSDMKLEEGDGAIMPQKPAA